MAVTIPYPVARQIADHALKQDPSEACGLLAGTRDHIAAAFPMRNVAEAAEREFQVDPNEQLQALKAIDDVELQWIGIYHSHPRSAPIPSDSDLKQWVDSELLQLIVSLDHSKPKLKLWRLHNMTVESIDLVYDTMKLPQREPALTFTQQTALLIVAVAAVLILLIISFSLLPPAPEITPAPRLR